MVSFNDRSNSMSSKDHTTAITIMAISVESQSDIFFFPADEQHWQPIRIYFKTDAEHVSAHEMVLKIITYTFLKFNQWEV